MTNIVQVSWKTALGVIDARLATVPLEHGTKLRHWRETVVEIYSDFAEKLPDPELPTLARQASWVDGRAEESRYPNLMLPGVKQQYGI